MKRSRIRSGHDRKGRFSRAVALFCVLLGFLSARTGRADAPSIVGQYVYVGGEAEKQGIFAAIDGVVARMNVFVRGIARRRLRKPNLPSAEIGISVDDHTITVRSSNRQPVSAPRDGSATKWHSPEGDFMVTHILDGSTMIATIDGKSSRSTNRYVLDRDGRTMHLTTHIHSARLPADVDFSLTYRRATPPLP